MAALTKQLGMPGPFIGSEWSYNRDCRYNRQLELQTALDWLRAAWGNDAEFRIGKKPLAIKSLAAWLGQCF